MDKSRYDSWARWICAVAFCVWVYVLDLKYYNFGYWSWDLPLYGSVMWNLCHGSLNSSLFGGNFLIDHFDGVAFFLVPFYYFFQSAVTLLVFKLLAFFIGTYVFYLLASKRLGGFWGMMFMLGYMFSPPNISMLLFEFNFENLALPLIFMLFYFFEENNFSSFLICCFLLTIVKENMPLIVVMFGLYGFLKRREDWVRWGLLPLALGGSMFVVEVFIIIPSLRHSLSMYWYLYAKIGHNPQGILQTFICKPGQVGQLLFSHRNLAFLSELFGPLLTPALLSPQILFLGLPLFLQNLLSSFSGQQSVYYFYASILMVFIFMAAADFLGSIGMQYRRRVLGIMMGVLFLYEAWYLPQWRIRLPSYHEKQAVDDYLLSLIPPDAGVSTTYNLLYFLSQRKDIYVIGQEWNPFTHKMTKSFQNADYALIDFATHRIDDRGSIKNMLSNGAWTVQAAANESVLLKKNAVRGGRLIESQKTPFVLPSWHSGFTLNDVLKLDAVDVPSTLAAGQRILRVTFYWEALKRDPDKNLPPVYLRIYQGKDTRYFKKRAPLYGLPVKKGEYDKDIFYYLIPKLGPGDYQAVVMLPVPSGPPGIVFKIFRPLHIRAGER